MTTETPCHYCGADYAEGRRGDADALVRHLKSECTEVPEPIRQSYEQRCAFGNCEF